MTDEWPNWVAESETGRTYVYGDGFVTFTEKNGSPHTIKLWYIKTATVSEDDGAHIAWPWVNETQWEDARVPVVGRRLFMTGKDEWRMSTPIVSVRVGDDG